MENRNIALDYRLNPEHISWLDATAKIYYVDTNDETDNANSLFKEYFWTQTRLKTRGLQLQNTNTFTPSDAHQIRLKYGLEWFSDKSEGYSTRKLIERTTPPASALSPVPLLNLTTNMMIGCGWKEGCVMINSV